MEIKILTKKEIKQVYNDKIKTDFPKKEIKPFKLIKKLIRKKLYVCYGFVDAEKINAYAFCAKTNADEYILLDYFAVERDLRNNGVGEVCLKMLADRLKNYKAIICEVEDPTDNSDKSYESLRKRRINFYERNSYKTTSLKCDMCGMILNVMYRADTEIEEEEIFHAIENIYDTTLTKNLAEKIMVFKS